MKIPKFNPLFVCTQSPGDVYYRMGMFSKHMGGRLFPKQSLYANPNWEEVISETDVPLKELDEMMKTATHVVWQRLTTFRGLAVFMAFRDKYKVPMFTEIDDDAFNVDSTNPGFISMTADAKEVFSQQMKLSKAVIVSTDYLKESYRRFNKNIFVVKNCIDFDDWKVKKVPHKGIRVLFQGGMQHTRDLMILQSVVPKILKEHKVEFHFFGCMPECFNNVGKGHLAVPILEYPKRMGQLNPDIIVAPLYDNHMNRARSNLRALEAGALGVPVVASAGKLPYTEIINRCGGGFLANTTEEWVESLGKLIKDKIMRVGTGKALNREVRTRYNVIDGAKRYTEILKGVK